jgi:tricorn protease
MSLQRFNPATRMMLTWCCALGCLAPFALSAQVESTQGYYRWPALRGDTLVFASEGDLWRVSSAGGAAQRLTTHAGEESMPAISPDGRWLGFVASYDSAPEVYVMPLAGGSPKRLSFDAARVLLQGFAADGSLLFGSDGVSGPSWTRQLRLVDPSSGLSRSLPVTDATDAVLSADGQSLWFSRFGLQVTQDNARAYRGGAMAQLWRVELDGGLAKPTARAEAQRLLPNWEGNLRRPLLSGERLLVISDADGTDNLWSMALDGSDAKALTAHREFPVRSASVDGAQVVYALGADLRLLNLSDGSDWLIDIQLPGDREAQRSRLVKKPLSYLTGASIAASGQRVALNLRGQVHLLGSGGLRRVVVASESGARLRSPVLSVDGKTVYAIRDLDGRSEIAAYPADGSPGSTRVYTDDGVMHRWRLYLSPDGKWLAHDDKQGRLWLLELASGKNRELDRAPSGSDQPYRDVVWSPDNQWLAVVRPDTSVQRDQLLLIAREGGKPQVLSSDRYPSFAPAFSVDGRWLYFLSQRHLVTTPGSPWGDRNTGPFFDRRTKVYALALQADGPRFPFLPVDELAQTGAATSTPNAADSQAKGASDLAGLQSAGLAQRLYEVPLAAGNYSALAIDGERLYLLDRDAASDAKPVLKTVTIGVPPTTAVDFAKDVMAFALSADRKQLYLQKIGADNAVSELLLLPAAAKAPDDTSKHQLKLGDNALAVSPAQEWRQMFDDAWRMHAQFSFDTNMRGANWAALRARFAPLLDRVGERSELDDLLAQMIAEIGLLHSQIRPGEARADGENSADAFLGGEFVPSPNGGGLRVERLWATEAELPSERGPLQAAGIDVQVGDRLLAVNGRSVQTPAELSAALLNQAGQQTLIETQRGSAPTRRFVVQPVPADREATLRYGDWVQRTREAVQSAGAGQIGYLHLRAMGSNDMAGFVREFYANFDRPALIIDVRRNRGGNIDSWVLDKLLRRTWAYWHPPGRQPYWNMPQTFRGHLVVLADALTYSDGETFAAGIQALGLGPVIGVRTAGAGIWLSDRNRLVDNGVARIAEFGQFDAAGRWLIEGAGVEPDIEVVNLPVASAGGADAQLAAAIGHLQQRLREAPVQMPATQAIPAVGSSAQRRAKRIQ